MLRRISGSFVMAVLVIVCAGVVGAAPAMAHTDLESSSPNDGATLSEVPASIDLTFSESVLSEGAAIVVRTDTDTPVDVGAVTVDGATVSVAWPADADSGRFNVAWRVVADDGHPIEGTLSFTIEAPSPAPTSASPTATSASPSPTSTSASPAPTNASPTPTSASPSPSPSATTSSSTTSPLAIVGGIVAIAVLAAVVIALVRRQRN